MSALCDRLRAFSKLQDDKKAEEALAIRAAAGRLSLGSPPAKDLALQVLVRHERARTASDGYGFYDTANAEKPAAGLRTNPELARIAAPLLGDEAVKGWPFLSPLEISTPKAIEWLDILGDHAVPNGAILDFVESFLRLRPRTQWRPAARALGKMAARDSAALSRLNALWAQVFNGKPLPEDPHHLRRHLRSAAAAYIVAGGSPASLLHKDPVGLSDASLPVDMADASAALLAQAEAARNEVCWDSLKPHLRDRLARAKPDFQVDEAVREMLEAISGHPASDAQRRDLLDWLVTPRWRNARFPEGVDILHGWLETAKQLRSRDPGALLRMREAAGEAAFALSLALGDESLAQRDLASDLVQRMAVILDPDVLATTPSRRLVLAVAEAALLVESAELKDLPWGAIADRAMGQFHAVHPRKRAFGPSRSVGEEGRAKILAALSSRLGPSEREVNVPKTLLYDQRLGEAVVLDLAGNQNPPTATQVAIQLERLLRGEKDSGEKGPLEGEAQLKLLWRVLQEDPPRKLFEELAMILRKPARGENPLLPVIDAVRRLDEIEENEVSAAKAARLSEAYGSLGRCASKILSGAIADGGGAAHFLELAGLMESLSRAPIAGSGEVGSKSWWDGVQGLVTCAGDIALWAERGIPGLKDRLRDFEEAHGRVRDPRVVVADCDLLDAAVVGLADAARRLPRPERRFVEARLDEARAWNLKRREASASRANEEEMARQRLKSALARSDEDEATRLAADKNLRDRLDVDGLRGLHSFLLNQHLFGKAKALRQEVSSRVDLPSATSRLMGLAAAVSGGVVLLLSFFEIWIELQRVANSGRLVLTAIVLLATTFALLAYEVGARMSGNWLRVVWRVLPVFAGACAYAAIATTLVLWALTGTKLSPEESAGNFGLRVLIWASLGLFLGVVVERAMRGKKATEVD